MPGLRIAYWTLLVGVLTFLVKLLAYRVTGSVAVLSDALESLVNLAAGVGMLAAIRYANRPPDASHPFGHTKAEYLSAVVEGVLVVLAAGVILHSAVGRLWHPVAVARPEQGLFWLALAALANGGWATYLIRRGRALASAALEADGWHLLADSATSLAVMAGLALAWLTGLPWIDPIFALLVALHVLWIGVRIVRRSVGGLLDEALDPATRAAIEQAVAGAMQGAIEVHDLRTRRGGSRAFVELHLVVPGAMSVEEAHAIATRIEEAVSKVRPGAEVTVHVEPEGELKHRGIRPVQGHPFPPEE